MCSQIQKRAEETADEEDAEKKKKEKGTKKGNKVKKHCGQPRQMLSKLEINVQYQSALAPKPLR